MSQHSRRTFLHTAGALAALGAVPFITAGGPGEGAPASPAARTGPVPAAEALRILEVGNDRFEAGQTIHPNRGQERRRDLASGQAPFAVIVGCADSRTDPTVLFDTGLGDLFVVRTAGNIVDRIGLGSIEFAVAVLGARLVMVMGHSSCGAVEAAIGGTAPGAIISIVEDIQPAVASARNEPGNQLINTTKANVRRVRDNLRNQPSLMTPLIQSGQVQIVGAYYDLAEGEVEII